MSGGPHGLTTGTIFFQGKDMPLKETQQMADYVKANINFDPKTLPKGLERYNTLHVIPGFKGLYLRISNKDGTLR